MQGVGPGTLLGGRYSLRRRLTRERTVERWSAHDTTLQRAVELIVVDWEHPNRAGILDAARRAAGVEDTRLVRILDVGAQAATSFIVEEALVGAESLATILLQGALPAEEARRIAGEAASGLETARQRGLHHLRLSPHTVLRTPDGVVKIRGVAVAAAVDEAEETDPAAASRRDAVSVVAIAYAGLTTRWPLPEQVVGVEPAPRVVGGVAAPSEIAAGVPGDLDALCRMTINEDLGPLTPGEFASQIAPWSRGPVQSSGIDPAVSLQLPSSTAPRQATISIPSAGKAHESQDEAGRGTARDQDEGGARPGLAATTASTGTAATTTRGTTLGTAVGTAVGTALTGAGLAAGALGGKVGSFARAAADKAAAAKAAHAASDLPGGRMTLPEALLANFDEKSPPLPLLPDSTGEPPSRDQSKVVVAIVATFVVLSLFVAYCGTRGLGDNINLPHSSPKRTVTVTAPTVTVAPKAPRATPSAGPVAGPVAGPPIAILSATGFDPDGDRAEKNTQAPRVYDDNPDTSWTSEGYSSADFGGLGKRGVGVRLDLGQPTSVNQVIVDLGSGPVDVTVYAATNDSLDAATAIGTAKGASGRVTLNAATTMPAAQYVIVWFTKLAPDKGRFRASISEIALT